MSPDPADLERRLDEAGRICQPRDPGWESLLARLGPRGTARGAGGWHRFGRWLAAAAALLAAAFALSRWIGPGDPTAVALHLDVEVQPRGVTITVFNAGEFPEPTLYQPLATAEQRVANDAGFAEVAQRPANFIGQTQMREVGRSASPVREGLALVRDERMVLHLAAGDNLVRFTDVAATIDPTSVRLMSQTDPTGTKVIEQNFEFDLATADSLLKRYVDRHVACLERQDGVRHEGYLVSYDAQSITLADRPPGDRPDAKRRRTQTISRGTLSALQLAEVPKDLHTRPTLVWKLRAAQRGDQLMTLTYLCGDVEWQADYVAVLRSSDDQGDLLDLQGWVTIDNRSGATYRRSGIKLIAGDVNRVQDPWAVRTPTRLNLDFDGTDFAMKFGFLGAVEGREFVQKEFFEYKLYELNQPSTVADRQTKQLNLLQAAGVRARRRFLFDPAADPGRLQIQLLVKNEKNNRLGMPLPKGRIVFEGADAEGELHVQGRDAIEHTAKDEELTLKLGWAFDLVGEYRLVSTQKPNRRRQIDRYEIRLRNHRDQAAQVRAVGSLAGHVDWQVTAASDPFTKHDFQTLHFDLTLPANAEKQITYTVDYQW